MPHPSALQKPFVIDGNVHSIEHRLDRNDRAYLVCRVHCTIRNHTRTWTAMAFGPDYGRLYRHLLAGACRLTVTISPHTPVLMLQDLAPPLTHPSTGQLSLAL